MSALLLGLVYALAAIGVVSLALVGWFLWVSAERERHTGKARIAETPNEDPRGGSE